MATTFDPAKSSPQDAQKLIAQVGALLGVDDPEHASHDEIDQALDALFARVTGGDPQAAAVTDPRVTNSYALTREDRALLAREIAKTKTSTRHTSALTPQQRRICRETGTTESAFLAAQKLMLGPR